jgi:hypothetical protein
MHGQRRLAFRAEVTLEDLAHRVWQVPSGIEILAFGSQPPGEEMRLTLSRIRWYSVRRQKPSRFLAEMAVE